jgi:excisionase family DNA binding protein
LTLREASRVTGLARWRLYDLCSRRQIPFMRIGRTLRFSEAALAEWIAEQHQAPTAE